MWWKKDSFRAVFFIIFIYLYAITNSYRNV